LSAGVQLLADHLEPLGLKLSDAQKERFAAYEEALYRANEVMNLTRVPRDECWVRHFLDSMLFQDLIPIGSSVLDIGSGPGFPSWPLACARPDLNVTALDSSGKMLGFLRTMSLDNLAIVQERAEEWGVRDAFDLVTGRALAPLSLQLELSAAPCGPNGQVIPMRTPSDIESIEAFTAERLGLRLERVEERVLPVVEAPRIFPIYIKDKPTPKQYPRPWAEMKRSPL
jgi:16S rRNA (guanine527-N7)-methyltransferase